MNPSAIGFIDAYQKELRGAITAVGEVLKAGKSLALESDEVVSNAFLVIGITCLDDCNLTLGDDVFEFIYDLHFSIDGGDLNYIDGTSIEDKRNFVRKAKESLSRVLAESDKQSDRVYLVQIVINACEAYDSVFGSKVKEGLIAAIARYIQLIHVKIGSVEASANDLSLYFELGASYSSVPQHRFNEENGFNSRPSVKKFDPLEEQSPDESLESALLELNSLVGLADIKREVSQLVSILRVQRLRRDVGLRSLVVSHHMVFYGNPGTGKTTVARILAKVYKALGLLSVGHFLEVDKSSLVGGYLGQTVLKTREVLEESMGVFYS